MNEPMPGTYAEPSKTPPGGVRQYHVGRVRRGDPGKVMEACEDIASLRFLHRIPLGLVGQWGCPGVGEGKIGDQPLEPGTPAVRRRERRCRIESISVDFTLLGPRMNLPAASP
jgi:hypothetical protein